MGFFSDLKEDLSQAVNELMPEDERNKANEPADESEISLDEMLKNIDNIQLDEEMNPALSKSAEASYDFASPASQENTAEPAAADTVSAWQDTAADLTAADTVSAWQDTAADLTAANTASAWQDTAADFTAPEAEPAAQDDFGTDAEMERLLAEAMGENPEGGAGAEAQQEGIQSDTIIMEESKGEEEEMDMGDMELARNQVVSDETSVITEGMTITGDINTQGSIDVIGTVNGNIDALGKLNITGHVNGNSKAAEIYAESAKINGEIVSEGAVKIGASSVIIGNISAISAAIAGAVKGDIDVKGPVILDASAIVMGNIKSKSVQINNGAVIEGMCSQCYADVSPTSFFDEYKPDSIRKPKTKQTDK